jgi:predicted dehydrogenase
MGRIGLKKLKTAVIGVGALGRHHARWLNQLDRSELVGLYDLDSDKAKENAEKLGCNVFGSVEQVAEQAEAVSIVVTTSAHFEIAKTLIDAGVHCLIEKPIAATLEDAQKIEALAAKEKVKVTVGQIERFNPAIRALAEYDVQPSFVEAHRLAPFDPRGTDVAVILDLMIHDIDLVLSTVKSKVVDIQASAVPVISDRMDIANARLSFENGAVANLTASRISLQPMRKLRFFQKSGYVSLDLAKKEADIYWLAEAGESVDGFQVPLGKSGQSVAYTKAADDGKDMLGLELETFVDAVLDDKPVAVTVAEATEALRVALDVERIGRESGERMIASSQV